MNFLLDFGADANTSDLEGNTLIHIAVEQNINKETIQNIIDHRADVNVINNEQFDRSLPCL